MLISQALRERKPFFPAQVNMFTAAAQTRGGWDSHVTHMSTAARKPLSLAISVLNKVRAPSSPFLANLPFIKPHQQRRRRLPVERTLSDARSRKLHWAGCARVLPHQPPLHNDATQHTLLRDAPLISTTETVHGSGALNVGSDIFETCLQPGRNLSGTA